MSAILGGNTDKKLFEGLLVTLGFSMLTPEYIAPFFVFALYVFFILHFKKTGRNAKLGNIGKVFFSYTVFMLISSIWSKTHLVSVLISLLWMGCFLTYILMANVINTKEKLKMAMTAINVSTGVIGLIAIVEIVTYNLAKHYGWDHTLANPLFFELNDRVFQLLPVEIINKPYSSRASATFDNPLILATYLVLTTPLCAFGSVYFKHSRNRKISRVCFLLAIGGIICTFSRGAYIAVGLSFVIMVISNKRVFKKLLPFVLVLAVAVPLALSLRYINTGGDFLASNNNRLDIWEYSFDMFLHHPLIGLGAGTDNIHTLLRDHYGIDRAHTHNLFLQAVVEGGIVGAAFVAAVIAYIVKTLLVLFRGKDALYRPYAIVYTSSLVGFITISMFEFTLQSAKEMMIFFALLGLIEATYRMETGALQLAEDDLLQYEELTGDDYEELPKEKEKVKEEVI